MGAYGVYLGLARRDLVLKVNELELEFQEN